MLPQAWGSSKWAAKSGSEAPWQAWGVRAHTPEQQRPEHSCSRVLGTNKHHSLKLCKSLPCNLFLFILKELIDFFYVLPQLIRQQKWYTFVSRIKSNNFHSLWVHESCSKKCIGRGTESTGEGVSNYITKHLAGNMPVLLPLQFVLQQHGILTSRVMKGDKGWENLSITPPYKSMLYNLPWTKLMPPGSQDLCSRKSGREHFMGEQLINSAAMMTL